MSGELNAPYREPSGGWPSPLPRLFNCGSHYRQSETGVPRKVVSVSPADFLTSAAGGWPALGAMPVQTFADPTSPPATVDFAHCRKRGRKQVQARKQWHGRFGFGFDGYGVGDFAVSTQRFLRQEVSLSMTSNVTRDAKDTLTQEHFNGDNPCSVLYQHIVDVESGARNFTYSVEVDKSSGERKLLDHSSTDTHKRHYRADYQNHTYIGAVGSGHEGESIRIYPFGDGEGNPDGNPPPVDTDYPNSSWASFHLNGITTKSGPDFYDEITQSGRKIAFLGDLYTAAELEAALDDWATENNVAGWAGFDRDGNPVTDNGKVTWTIDSDPIVTFTETSLIIDFGFSVDGSFFENDGDRTQEWTISGSYHFRIQVALGVPYTLATVVGENYALLGYWPLDDDTLHPWSVSDSCYAGVMVSRSEPQYGVQPGIGGALTTITDLASGTLVDGIMSYGTREWKDTDGAGGAEPIFEWKNPFPSTPEDCVDNILCRVKTGEVLGKPLPAGYEGWWDFYNVRSYLSGTDYSPWQPGEVTGIPKNATQITMGYPEGIPQPFGIGGAFVFVTLNGVLSQKYAEIKEVWPSQDFFRPCGADRAKVSGGDPLWPSAWGICGRVEVTAATTFDGSHVEITVAHPVYVKDGDSLDFTGVTGLTTVAVDDVDADGTGTTAFKVSGSLSSAYTSGGLVKSHGAPDYKWHDSGTKGDYVYRHGYTSLEPDVADGTLVQRHITVPLCCPAVMVCSPNWVDRTDGYEVGAGAGVHTVAYRRSESFPSAEDVANRWAADNTATPTPVLWRGVFFQRMYDLLYIQSIENYSVDAPHVDPDRIPWVEAMTAEYFATLSAPALPAGANAPFGGAYCTTDDIGTSRKAGDFASVAGEVGFPNYKFVLSCDIGVWLLAVDYIEDVDA